VIRQDLEIGRPRTRRAPAAPALAGCLAVAGALVAALLIAPASPALASGTKGSGQSKGSHGGAPSSGPKLAQAGKTTFWECSGRTTELLVAVSTLTLHPGATLDVSFTVRNGGATSCNYTAPYAGSALGPTVTTLDAGPCGSIGFEIVNASHHNVWPGPQVVNCPALGFAQLAPGATVSGTGTWNQTEPNTTARVPAGAYTLVVDTKHFSFPLTVAKS
jgi:hypothetical protein